MTRYLLILFLLTGCKSPAPVEPVTEQPREARPAPTTPPQVYRYYTNAADDRLVEGPPVVPNHGPFPMHVVPRVAVSNWLTPKAMAIQPKPFPNTNFPYGNVMLSRISTTDEKGKVFSAELVMHGNQSIQANDKVAVIIFALAHTNYTVEFSTNLTEGRWAPFSSGVSQSPDGAIVIVDLHEGTSPLKFYRQVETK